jgi:hypothetical protein
MKLLAAMVCELVRGGNMMRGPCSTHGTDEKLIQHFSRKASREKSTLDIYIYIVG